MTLLPQIMDQAVTEIAALPSEELALLQQQIESRLEGIKRGKEKLSDAIALKYVVKSSSLRQKMAKESGAIKFTDNDVSISANIAKKIQWDQDVLAGIAKRIHANGEDPLEFMTITYKIPESKYNAWPESLREQFSSARTLSMSRETFQLVSDKGGES